MPTEPETPTLAEIVRVAVETADPDGADPTTTELLTRFEDRDEPVTAVADVEEALLEARGAIEPDGTEALNNAVAVAIYLAHRRNQIGMDREELIRLATRAENVA